MGLPGSGKTTLASELVSLLLTYNRTVYWLNADIIREHYNDWDFSEEGRIRQSIRMRDLSETRTEEFVICDFVAPLPIMRSNFNPKWVIWVNTITEGRFEDTNKLFIPPKEYECGLVVTTQDAKYWAKAMYGRIIRQEKYFNETKI